MFHSYVNVYPRVSDEEIRFYKLAMNWRAHESPSTATKLLLRGLLMDSLPSSYPEKKNRQTCGIQWLLDHENEI